MKKLLTLFLGVVIFTGCYNDKEDQLYPKNTITCDTSNTTFLATIRPIMQQSCATSGCHDAATKQSGYDLSTHAGVKLALDDGKLLGSINQETGYSAMPKGMTKLDACAITKITSWVNKGAQNN